MFYFYRDAYVVFISFFVFLSEGLSCVNVSAQYIYTQVLKLDRLEFNMYIFERIFHKNCTKLVRCQCFNSGESMLPYKDISRLLSHLRKSPSKHFDFTIPVCSEL